MSHCDDDASGAMLKGLPAVRQFTTHPRTDCTTDSGGNMVQTTMLFPGPSYAALGEHATSHERRKCVKVGLEVCV